MTKKTNLQENNYKNFCHFVENKIIKVHRHIKNSKHKINSLIGGSRNKIVHNYKKLLEDSSYMERLLNYNYQSLMHSNKYFSHLITKLNKNKDFGSVVANNLQIMLDKNNITGGAVSSFSDNPQIALDTAIQRVKETTADYNFLSDKVNKIKDKLSSIIINNEKLYNLRLRVEWLVNKLEKEEEVTDQESTKEIEKMIKKLLVEIEKAPKQNDELVKTLVDLEKMVNYLEETIEQMTKTTDNAPERYKEQIENLGKLDGGADSPLQRHYLQKNEEISLNLKKIIKENLELDINNIDLKSDKYSKCIVALIAYLNLKRVISMIKDINKNNIFVNWTKLWEIKFGVRKTNYYQNLLKKVVNDFLNDDPKSLNEIMIKIDGKIKNMFKTIDIYNITNLYIYSYCLIFVLLDYLNMICITINDDPIFTELLTYVDDNLPKGIHFNYKSYSSFYDGEDISVHILFEKYFDKLKEIQYKNIKENEKLLLNTEENKSLYELYVKAVNKSGYKNVQKTMKDNLLNRILLIEKSLSTINNRVAQMAGKTRDSYYTEVKLDNTNSKDLEKFYKDLVKLYIKISPDEIEKILGGATRSTFTRPRMDKFIDKLNESSDKITDIIKYYKEFRRLIDTNGIVDQSNVNLMFKCYSLFKNFVDETISMYIKVLPIIYFAIEYRQDLYKKQAEESGFYNITFDPSSLKLIGKYQNGTETKLPKNCSSSYTYNGYNQVFLNDNNTNYTKELLDDPTIGLDKIISTSRNDDEPDNLIINMMFALGASGTGKTTRYLGINTPSIEPKDKNGIVQFIIKKSTTMNFTKIKLAYFLTYGRKNDFDNSNLNFSELLLFLKQDGDEIKQFGYMNKQKEEKEIDENNYINIGQKFITRKLYKVEDTNDSIKKYLIGFKNNIEPKTGSGEISFRDILEKDDIWMKIEQEEINSLENFMDKFISYQKEIRTVMPTINNIESSRSHTCILLKLSNSDGEEKFFPLFDLAGTENPENIKLVLSDLLNPENKESCKKMIKIVLT